MKKTIGLSCVVMVVLLALVCSKHERNNVFDTGGSNFHPPVVSAMNDTTVSMLDTIVLHAAVTDSNTSMASFIWQGIDTSFLDTTARPACEFFPLSSRHMRVAVRAVDNNGIASNWDTTVLDVHSYMPTVTAMADTVIAMYDSVRFHAQAFDTNGSITRFVWSIPACGKSDTTTGGLMSSRFDTAGTFSAIVCAIDKKGLHSPEDTFTVSVHTYAPLISVTDSFTTTGVGNTVHLAAHATDTNGTIAGYAWSFDGSAFVRTASPTYDTSFSSTGMKVILVKAIDDDSLFSRADTIRVAIKGNMPLLYAPINRAVTTNLGVVLTWMPGYYNHQYLIQFDTTNRFSFSISRPDTFLDVSSSLKFSTVYYWRVIGVSATGASDTSDTWSFTTPAMGQIQLLNPADNSSLTAASATLSWQPGYLRSHFQILLDTLNPPARTAIASQADSFYATGTLAYEKKYHWRVVASDLLGAKDSSSVRSFTTPAAPVTPTGGLVAYYPFNGNANDSSGNGHNGTVSGASLTTDRFRNTGSAYSFDGSASEIDIGALAPINTYTVSLWFRKNVSSNYLPGSEADLFGTQTGSTPYSYFKFGFHRGFPDKLVYFLRDVSTGEVAVASVNAITDTSWHQVVVTRANGTIQMFLDNQLITFSTAGLVESGSMTGAITTNSVTKIGTVGGVADSKFNGAIDDARIYDRVLTSSEIAALFTEGGWTGPVAIQPPQFSSDSASMTATATVGMLYKDTVHATNPNGRKVIYSVLSGPTGLAISDSIVSWTPATGNLGNNPVKIKAADTLGLCDTLSWTIAVSRVDGLVAYYPFTGNANDSSGNGHNGTVNGATLTADRFGAANSAYAFNGVNYIDIGNWGNINDITVSLWSRADSVPSSAIGYYYIFGASDYDNKIFEMFSNVTGGVYNPSYLISRVTANSNAGYLNEQITFKQWHHIVLTRSGQTIKMYLDGDTLGAMVSSSGFPQGSLNTINIGQNLYVGTQNSAGTTTTYPYGIKGAMDEVRIYNRAISGSEVKSLYDLGGWIGYPPEISSDSASMTPTATVGVLYKDTVHATNPNGRRVIYSVLSGPAGLAIADSIVSWNPATSNLGNCNVRIKAADSLGLCDTLSWTIAVSRADGLIAFYPFTGNAVDSSGSGNNGTVNGATLTTDRFGTAQRAYWFNGSSNEITAGSLPPIGDYSVSLWFKRGTTSSWAGTSGLRHFIGTQNSSNTCFKFGFVADSFQTHIEIGMNDYRLRNYGPSIKDTLWHNIVAVRVGDSVRLVMDGIGLTGQIVSTMGDPSGTISTAAVTKIGALGGIVAPVWYYGGLDEIRIYDRALSQSQIDSLYHLGGWNGYAPVFSQDSTSMTPAATPGVLYKDTVHATNPNGRRVIYSVLNGPTGLAIADSIVSWTPATTNVGNVNVKIKAADSLGLCDTLSWTIAVSRADGLIAYYPFDGNAVDSSGYGNTGTTHNVTAAADRFGNPGKAYYFNGQTAYVGCGVLNLNTSNSFTVSAWYKAQDYDYGVLVQEWDGSAHGSYFVDFGYETPPIVHARVGLESPDSVNQMGIDYPIDDTTTWHNLTLIYDKAQGAFYQFFDGIKIGSHTVSRVYDFSNEETNIGGSNHQSASNYFKGYVDDVRFYSRALSASEMSALYGAGGWVGKPPVFTLDSTTMTATATAGVLYKDTVHATNPSGRRVVFSVLSGPAGLSIADSIVTWTPSNGDAGLRNVKIKAADSLGLCDTLSWTIIVSQSGGLVAYYPFTGNANDSGGNGHDGTVNGATLVADRFGNGNSAYSFNGSSNYISIPDPNKNLVFNALTDNYTVSIWVKASQLPGSGAYGLICDKNVATSPTSIYLGLDPGGFSADLYSGAANGGVGAAIASTTASSAGKWFHLVEKMENHKLKLYVNGVREIGTISNTDSVTTSFATTKNSEGIMLIGKAYESYNYTNGAIDDVRIFNIALSDAQIDSLYHLGGWTGGAATQQHVLIGVGPAGGSINRICRMAPDGSSWDTAYASPKAISRAEWSPDKTKITFSANEAATNDNNVYLINADGSGRVQLTTATTTAGAYIPHFLNSTRIRFSEEVAFWDSRIFEIGTDGSGRRAISNMGGQQNDFGISGATMFLTRAQSGDANTQEIYKVDTGFVTSPVQLTNTSLSTTFCDISPDGSKVLITHHDAYGTSPDNLYDINTDGTGERKLTTITGSRVASYAQYSSDGTKILYSVFDGTQWDIWSMNADGTGQTQITNTASQNEVLFDWR